MAPERFGNYVVHERLGAGGMATVHRATLSGIAGFERPVALKRLLPHLAHDENFVRAFVREARIAAHLRHANVAQTYDLGLVGENYYIAMELIEGNDVRNVLKASAGAAGPMPPALVVNLLSQVCEALDYAHSLTDETGQPLGIVHRDVSPANIIIARDGTAKLIDFGIARATSSSLMTMSGQLKGKFAYIAPETIGGTFDARADLFSLGVVAHELLTAKPLLAGVDEIDTLRRVKEQDIPAPSTLAPGIPDEVDSIVMTALSRDPAERWQSAAAMRGALGVVASRANLRATGADLVRWIEWAMEVRPSARRAAVGGPGRDSGRQRARDTDVQHEPDSEDVSMVIEPGEPVTSDDAVEPVVELDTGRHGGPREHARADSFGAAPASSDTLEMLVGGGSTAQDIPVVGAGAVKLERTTAQIRTPNTTRRTPSRPQPAAGPAPAWSPPPADHGGDGGATLELHPRELAAVARSSQSMTATSGDHRTVEDFDARSTGRLAAYTDDLATTGHHRAFEAASEGVTLVDVVDANIIAEIATGPGSAPTLMIATGVSSAPDVLAPPRAGRASAPATARSSAVPMPAPVAPPPMAAPPLGSAPPGPPRATGPTPSPHLQRTGPTPSSYLARSGPTPSSHMPAPPPVAAASLPTMVATGTPHGVAAAPPSAGPFVHLGAEYNAAAETYAANVMTPPPGTLSSPTAAQIAEEAIRDDQARRTAARAMQDDKPAPPRDILLGPGPAPVARPRRRGHPILLLLWCAVLGGGVWAAYYFV